MDGFQIIDHRTQIAGIFSFLKHGPLNGKHRAEILCSGDCQGVGSEFLHNLVSDDRGGHSRTFRLVDGSELSTRCGDFRSDGLDRSIDVDSLQDLRVKEDGLDWDGTGMEALTNWLTANVKLGLRVNEHGNGNEDPHHVLVPAQNTSFFFCSFVKALFFPDFVGISLYGSSPKTRPTSRYSLARSFRTNYSSLGRILSSLYTLMEISDSEYSELDGENEDVEVVAVAG